MKMLRTNQPGGASRLKKLLHDLQLFSCAVIAE